MGRTRNYQIWIKMTLEQREKSLLLRWSRLVISSPEWRRGRLPEELVRRLLGDLRS